MPNELSESHELSHAVTSPSGEWELRYENGRAVISNRDGTTTWSAGEVGLLRLEKNSLVVYQGDREVWRSEIAGLGRPTSLHVTDEGDGLLCDTHRWPVSSLVYGLVEPVLLGERAPVAELGYKRGSHRFIKSANGRRTATRAANGDLMHDAGGGYYGGGGTSVVASESRRLEQPGTCLTWRFLEDEIHHHWYWDLVLVDQENRIRWSLGNGHHVLSDEPQPDTRRPTAAAQSEHANDAQDPEYVEGDGYSSAWMDSDSGLGMDLHYCVTVIHDISPDEALRRFGVEERLVSTATWREWMRRLVHEDREADDEPVAAFALGPHTLVVEEMSRVGASPHLSQGTFAVSASCNIAAGTSLLVSRNGKTLAAFSGNRLDETEGDDPGVLVPALADMGIDGPEEYDPDDDVEWDNLELLCRLAGIEPTVADISGPARVTILPNFGDSPPEMLTTGS